MGGAGQAPTVSTGGRTRTDAPPTIAGMNEQQRTSTGGCEVLLAEVRATPVSATELAQLVAGRDRGLSSPSTASCATTTPPAGAR
jgi:hypothetical protein